MPENRFGVKWTEEETILAFYYYCKIPFGKIGMSNPEIIKLAKLLGRSPGSVGLKLANLAHYDPSLQERNISGMKNTSKLDRAVVEKFYSDWEELSYRAKQIENSLVAVNTPSPPGTEVETIVRQRVNQVFFRESVLSAYGGKCCITGMGIPAMLIASHIKPWKDSDPNTERTNPCNGLCLNAMHDRAFDKGLITILPDFSIRVSSELKKDKLSSGTSWLISFDKQKIHTPDRFIPQREFLEYHNDIIFIP